MQATTSHPPTSLVETWLPVESYLNGIKLSSNTLLYQCFAYRSASLGSPQASLGQRVTAWDSSYFDRAARRLPWGRIPSNYLQEKGFRLT
jgi:hypothetical protein